MLSARPVLSYFLRDFTYVVSFQCCMQLLRQLHSVNIWDFIFHTVLGHFEHILISHFRAQNHQSTRNGRISLGCTLKVSWFQNVLLVSSFGPKYQWKIWEISALEFEKWTNHNIKALFNTLKRKVNYTIVRKRLYFVNFITF